LIGSKVAAVPGGIHPLFLKLGAGIRSEIEGGPRLHPDCETVTSTA